MENFEIKTKTGEMKEQDNSAESFTSLESLENSLTNLKEKLSAFENMPLYASDIADLKKTINTLESRILEQKN